MAQRKSQGTDDQDPGQLLQEESNQERREEEGGAPPDGTQQGGDGRGGGRPSRQRGGRDGLWGRTPSPDPDVFMDVPKVKVEEIYLDVEGLVRTCRCEPSWPTWSSWWPASTSTWARSSWTSRAWTPRPC